MATMAQDGQVQAQPVKKKRMSLRGFVNSPWVLVAVPLIVGGFYLIGHPELVQVGVNNPYAVAFVASIPVCLIAIKLIINFFSVIEQWMRLQFEKARQARKGFFFEIVTVVFMFVSVCEAGPFFNDIQHSILSGALGYITVLAFDLIAVVCIDARRKELAKGGTRSGIYLLGVIICALVSMAANLYSALQNFHAPADPSIPAFLKSVAPYIGIMFPVMIIFLAFSRDADIEIDDAEAYRKQQQKRVDFLAVRREILAAITHEMEQIELLKKREFILKSWLFTSKKMNLVVEIVTGKVEQEISLLKRDLEAKEQTISRQFLAMQQMAEQFQNQQQVMVLQMAQLSQFQEKMEASYTDFQASIVSMIPGKEQPNYQQIAQIVESKLQPKMEAWVRAQESEIAKLKRAQKMETKKERITRPLDSQNDDYDGNRETSFDEMLNEISEEEVDQIEGPSTNPKMEIVGDGNSQLDGNAETPAISMIDITTRRKPLPISDVATIIGRTEKTVRNLCNQGKLEKDDQGMIKVASVRSYLASKQSA